MNGRVGQAEGENDTQSKATVYNFKIQKIILSIRSAHQECTHDPEIFVPEGILREKPRKDDQGCVHVCMRVCVLAHLSWV